MANPSASSGQVQPDSLGSVVHGGDLQRTPAPSVNVALQGKLSGILNLRASGAPGGPGIVNIRGIHTIFGRFAPLYVVDGVRIRDEATPISFGVLSAVVLDFSGLP